MGPLICINLTYNHKKSKGGMSFDSIVFVAFRLWFTLEMLKNYKVMKFHAAYLQRVPA